eukprot:4068818-Pleurochrysis_carterae.AAC.1
MRDSQFRRARPYPIQRGLQPSLVYESVDPWRRCSQRTRTPCRAPKRVCPFACGEQAKRMHRAS